MLARDGNGADAENAASWRYDAIAALVVVVFGAELLLRSHVCPDVSCTCALVAIPAGTERGSCPTCAFTTGSDMDESWC